MEATAQAALEAMRQEKRAALEASEARAHADRAMASEALQSAAEEAARQGVAVTATLKWQRAGATARVLAGDEAAVRRESELLHALAEVSQAAAASAAQLKAAQDERAALLAAAEEARRGL